MRVFRFVFAATLLRHHLWLIHARIRIGRRRCHTFIRTGTITAAHRFPCRIRNRRRCIAHRIFRSWSNETRNTARSRSGCIDQCSCVTKNVKNQDFSPCFYGSKLKSSTHTHMDYYKYKYLDKLKSVIIFSVCDLCGERDKIEYVCVCVNIQK